MNATKIDHTIDTLLDGRIQIVQPRTGYRVAIDSVLLAASVPVLPKQTVLDAGAGTGAVSFCLVARQPDLRVTALEMNAMHRNMLEKGMELNGMAKQVQLVAGDLRDPPPGLRSRQFDHVATNPPYYADGCARRPANSSSNAADHQTMPLDDWIEACARRVRSGGFLTLIHRAEEIGSLVTALHRQFGGLKILPLWPDSMAASAKRVILSARKGSRAPAQLCRGVVLHEADGSFTSKVQKILRDGAPLNSATDLHE